MGLVAEYLGEDAGCRFCRVFPPEAAEVMGAPAGWKSVLDGGMPVTLSPWATLVRVTRRREVNFHEGDG